MMMIGIDLETTGLNKEEAKILEVAMILVDENLEILRRFRSYVYYESPLTEEDFEEGAYKMHQESGLLEKREAARPPEEEIKYHWTPDAMQRRMVGTLESWSERYGCFHPSNSPLMGSSVHFDRAILEKQMPWFIEEVHYRNVDVSGFTELAKLFHCRRALDFPRNATHHAMDDIENSLEILRTVRKRWMKPRWWLKIAAFFRSLFSR